jgi:hypothetical protein
MMPESRNNPLLDNGSITHVSVTTNRHAIVHELLEVVVSIRFAPSYKRGHVIEKFAKIFVILGKVKPGIESIRGLNLAVVKHMTVQVTRLS